MSSTDSNASEIEFNKSYTNLLNRTWKTKKCRFNAEERLKCRHKFFVCAIYIFVLIQASMSSYLLAFDTIDVQLMKFIAVSSVIVSFSISLITSQDPVSKDLLEAYKLHDCAKRMHKIQSELEYGEHLPVNEKRKLYQEKCKEYAGLIASYDVNQSPVDNDLVEATHKRDFPDGPNVLLTKTQYFISKIRSPLLYSMPPVLIIVALYFLMY